MQNNSTIIQSSSEWYAAKQKTIGASEIFSLVRHYCSKELEALGFNLLEEKSFRTVQELFMKVKFDAKLSEIDPIHSEFGNGMEAYVAYRLGQELPKVKSIERSKDFWTGEKLHPLAACSPDGFIYLGDQVVLRDFDDTCDIDQSWGCGALELKTANYFANFGSEKGSRLHYIFQLQYQMAVLGLKWGCLTVLIPKEKQFDEAFFKGKILRELEIVDAQGSKVDYTFNTCYDLKYYIYPQLPVFQAMIMKALNAFQADLDGYDQGKQECFPRNSEDLAGLQREKAMWTQIWPEHFGTKELSEEEVLNKLLNERYQAQVESMFAEQNQKKIENEICQYLKQNQLEKFIEIKGTENRLLFIKNGQIRYFRLKETKCKN